MVRYFYLFPEKASVIKTTAVDTNLVTAALNGSPDEQSGPEVLRLAMVSHKGSINIILMLGRNLAQKS